MNEPRKLKRAVIKEELVELTGDYIKAVILNQFLYWMERTKDFDSFKKQEHERTQKHGTTKQDTIELTDGWFYKSADELSEETMLKLSRTAIRTHIKSLVEMGFVNERNNPKYKWDKIKQYRVNLAYISSVLKEKGYTLENYSFDVDESRSPENESRSPENELRSPDSESRSKYNYTSESNNLTAIPEITTETNTKTTSKEFICESDCKQSDSGDKSPYKNDLRDEKKDRENEGEQNKPKRTSKPFIPPTIEEIKAYCEERHNDVNPQKFYDYYSASDWHDSSGKKLKSWKQKLITWENNGYNNKPKQDDSKKWHFNEPDDEDEIVLPF